MPWPREFDYRAELAYYSTPVTELKEYEWLDADMREWVPNYPHLFRGKRILDIGAGEALQAILIAERYEPRRVVGLELVPHRLLAASYYRRKKLLRRLELVSGDCYSLPFKENEFDIVLGNGILHHLPDLPLIVTQIAKVLRSGGLYVGREPNFHNPMVHWRVLKARHHSKNEYGLLPRDVAGAFARCGFEVQTNYFWRRFPWVRHRRLSASIRVWARKT